MNRREFLRRSAPWVAAGLVTPSFLETLIRMLFGSKRYWDMGAANRKAVDCMGLKWLALDPAVDGGSATVLYVPSGFHVKQDMSVDAGQFVISKKAKVRYAEKPFRPEFYGTITLK